MRTDGCILGLRPQLFWQPRTLAIPPNRQDFVATSMAKLLSVVMNSTLVVCAVVTTTIVVRSTLRRETINSDRASRPR